MIGQKFVSVSIFLFAFMIAEGQTSISLTFSAEQNGNYRSLDSICIKNLTQGGDTTLYGNDTMLVLFDNIGTDEVYIPNRDALEFAPPYPNPATGSATLHLLLGENQLLKISVFDLLGRELFSVSEHLPAGNHYFELELGREKSYFITAETSKSYQMRKLVNLGAGRGGVRLTYSGYKPGLQSNKRTMGAMHWNPGDSLHFTGYSGPLYPAVLKDNPIVSQQYTFQFFPGQPCPGIPTVTDYDGNVYNTVQIGSQCWMRENLRVRTFRDGNMIPEVTIGAQWKTMASSARCWYNNDSALFASSFGALYNGYVVEYPYICPSGWKIPTDKDWKAFEVFLGMTQNQADSGGWRGTIEGGKMKESGSLYWNAPNVGATNTSGYSAFAGGTRGVVDGSFNGKGFKGNWWSVSVASPTTLWYRELANDKSTIRRETIQRANGLSVRCLVDTAILVLTVPQITTNPVSAITFSSATSGGDISYDGGSPVTVRGICWSLNPQPTLTDFVSTDGSGFGTFISNISGLQPYTTYYVRAYATNSIGTGYGNQQVFTTYNQTTIQACQGLPSVSDYNGNVYTTMQIGYQCWLRENLKVRNFNNGNPIPNITDQILWISSTSPGRSWYNNDSLYFGNKYGALYNGFAIESGNLCPAGWRVPTNMDWLALEIGLGVSPMVAATLGTGVSSVGGMLKEAGTINWSAPNSGATDYLGFSALPGGGRSASSGYYYDAGQKGYWSSSTLSSSSAYWNRSISYNSNELVKAANTRNMGLSVRCVKDIGFTAIIPPIVIIDTNYSINSTSVTVRAIVTHSGGDPIQNKGFCWATSPNPTLASNDTNVVSSADLFSHIITGLNPDTTYYIRAFATNNAGTGYSNDIQVLTPSAIIKPIPPPCPGKVVVFDHNLNYYLTVQNGNQCWMKENLKARSYNNGVPIPLITDNTGWANTSTGARCWNNNDSLTNASLYGALYNHYTVMNGNVCPTGWHVPTQLEWNEMIAFNGGQTVAGGALKSTGTTYWASPNNGATNSSLFSALPGGNRSHTGGFTPTGSNAYFHTSTIQSNYSLGFYLISSSTSINSTSSPLNRGLSIRCISDSVNAKLAGAEIDSIYSITPFSATATSTATSDGVLPITNRGVVWSLLPNPTIDNYHTSNGIDTGTYISHLTGLQPFTTYYVRPYSMNALGVSYGQQVTFITYVESSGQTCQGMPTVTDNSGNVYNTVAIGGQCWMRENLRSGHYNDNSPIPTISNQTTWANLTTGARCWYNHDSAQYAGTFHGPLYNWHAVQSGKLCPSGWHVPTEQEVMILLNNLGGGSIAGYASKEVGTSSWAQTHTGVTNSSGFTAVPAGRNLDYLSGSFQHLTHALYLWTTTPHNTYTARNAAWSGSTASVYTSYNDYACGMSVRCVRDSIEGPVFPPVMWIDTIALIGSDSARITGTIAQDGGLPVLGRGFAWSINPNPTLSNPFSFDGVGTGVFTGGLSSLQPGTIYYVRAYAITQQTVHYSAQSIFVSGVPAASPCPLTPTVTDYNGNVYNTVLIGQQCWMKENLKVRHYNNGISIPNITSNSLWGSNTTGARCWYGNDSLNYAGTFGALYNWYAVNHGNLCPVGWIQPNSNQWWQLLGSVGGQSGPGNLKDTTFVHWMTPNAGATNSSGFTGLPGGLRTNTGAYGSYGTDALWWMTESNGNLAYYMRFRHDTPNTTVPNPLHPSSFGMSVRCFKNYSHIIQ
jgi:uncharacterized protein (TIGR02145 family)